MDNISKILTPWLQKEKEEKKLDNVLFERILVILEPAEIRDFICLLSKAYYYRNQNKIIQDFNSFSELATTIFYRHSLKKSYFDLKKSINELDKFLKLNFSQSGSNDVLLLSKSNDDHTIYDYNIIELNRLLNNFDSYYSNFIKTGKEEYITILQSLTALLYLIILGLPVLYGAINLV